MSSDMDTDILINPTHESQKREKDLSGHHDIIRDESPEVDILGSVYPFRIFQLLGVWQPSSVPKVVSWLYYLAILIIELWSTIWMVYYHGRSAGFGIGIISAIESLLHYLLWLLVPFLLNAKGENAILTIVDFALKKKHPSLPWVNHAFVIGFFLVMIPQLSYFIVVDVPFILQKIVYALPFGDSMQARIFNSVFLIAGRILNYLIFNSTLLLLSLTAVYQSFPLFDFQSKYLAQTGSFHPSNIKPGLHLVVQSLATGNRFVEPLNGLVVLQFVLRYSNIAVKIVYSTAWDVAVLTPLLIIILQSYYFLLPPAYVTRCWERTFSKILTLFALSPTPDNELSSILLYLVSTKIGYSIANIRIDVSRVLYLTILVVALLGVEVQSTLTYIQHA